MQRMASVVFVLLTCTCVAGVPTLVVVGAAAVELGSFSARQKRTATFRLRNSGDAELTIRRIRQTCGCFTVAIDRPTLSPAAEAVVTVDLIPQSVSHRFRKTVYIHSSDPARPVTRLHVSGDAIPTVEVLPNSSIFVGRVPLGTAIQRRFHLRLNERGVTFGEPTALPAAAGRAVELSLPSVTTNVPYSVPVLITLMPPSPPGRFTHTVTIPIASPTGCRPITVKVFGESTQAR